MKNITVTVPDEVYRDIRIYAAEQGTSVSALVRKHLIETASGGSDFERRKALMNQLFARHQDTRANGEFAAGDRLSREEIHERRAVR